ncbi:MAG: leucyl/phenylalanyl-tRNA--protein transferase [Bacteroidales bacterium]|nr:leucyl/phenylalanyl-tRNA--protein transferase [Bacteroidales bacterium]MCF8352389.1 leucyl/phenylalanyl-tRNA--protein transferase [Bacteroidales bacterium]MCF8376020.1 leucyl/phenylalanyl-tRNA--protein transferase [Bacteroidales bacterium]MCF8402183.1 leucyl/phenylalanyl-tRNA--protein transferase [Bacteroidales bacterium]
MPVYQLTEELVFPHPELAEKDGLLAIGGDLSQKRLVLAYANGIFPWYSKGSPVIWWSPDPRMVLFPGEMKVSKSLHNKLNRNIFEIKADTAFAEVIERCASVPRKEQDDTWITKEMKRAYISLHENGYAHSIEAWYKGKLVGGLYGVSLGGAFFGESMFYNMTDASKVCLYHLVEKAKEMDFSLIDVQQDTPHLRSLGARDIPRKKFLSLLKDAMKHPTHKGKWSL